MKVTLKYPHTHAGVAYAAGQTIDVPVVDALWLKGEDLIEEAVSDIKAELKKLATKDNPAPHAEALAKAVAAEAAAKEASADDAPSSGASAASAGSSDAAPVAPIASATK